MRNFLSLLIPLILCSVSLASTRVPGWPSIASKRADEHTRQMEEARLAEWVDRTFGFDVLASCKYASSISAAPPAGKVALTFDDGPDPRNHSYVLGILRKHKIKATFFFVGKEAAAHISLVADVLPGGHRVASHSWDHSNFHKLSTARQAKQVTDADRVLAPFYSGKKYFRYPYGNSSCETNKFLKNRGYKFVGWHIDSCDWGFNKTGSVTSSIARGCGVTARNMNDYVGHVVDTVRDSGGGILLLHEVQPNTLRKLDEIIGTLLRDGYQFVNLDAPEMQASLW